MSVMIGIRIGKAEKKKLADAAKAAGMTLSGFLRFSAREEARRVLRDHKTGRPMRSGLGLGET